jgi:hypothetical protein
MDTEIIYNKDTSNWEAYLNGQLIIADWNKENVEAFLAAKVRSLNS